jgi:CPA2 family monovalent cation:proton (H+) antiporter-2
MKKVLIISGHPELRDNSFANKIIMGDLAKLLPDAVIDDLSALYPDYKINVEAEQKKLTNADIIVLQFPIFWYSCPALLAKWMEDVFVRGFSHGSQGKALVGKKLLLSFTTGAPESAYDESFPMDAMTGRFSQTAVLTGMIYEGYVCTGGVSYADRTAPARTAAMTEVSHAHAKRLLEKITSLM